MGTDGAGGGIRSRRARGLALWLAWALASAPGVVAYVAYQRSIEGRRIYDGGELGAAAQELFFLALSFGLTAAGQRLVLASAIGARLSRGWMRAMALACFVGPWLVAGLGELVPYQRGDHPAREAAIAALFGLVIGAAVGGCQYVFAMRRIGRGEWWPGLTLLSWVAASALLLDAPWSRVGGLPAVFAVANLLTGAAISRLRLDADGQPELAIPPIPVAWRLGGIGGALAGAIALLVFVNRPFYPPLRAPAVWFAAPGGAKGADCRGPAAPCPSINAALAKAGHGDVIVLAPGTYDESLQIDTSVAILGRDAATTIIDGGQPDQGAGLSPQRDDRPVIDVYGGRSVALRGVTVQHGRGGIRNMGDLTLAAAALRWNAAVRGGGLSNLYGGSALLVDALIAENRALGELAEEDSWGEPVGSGGGIYNESVLLIENSAILSNSALYGGGGLTHDRPSFSNSDKPRPAASLINVTVAANRASHPDYAAGGVYSSQPLTLTSVTLTDNISPRPAQLFVDSFTDRATVRNSIIGDAAGGANCGGATAIISAGHNVDSGRSCGFIAASDRSGIDPRLGPLAPVAGRLARVPASDSPARDGGPPEGCPALPGRASRPALDGDGDGRAGCDIGAHEAAGR